ncbi:ECF-type sigma factor [Cognaticolwellia mytili]|uniref:ECF-type sigma factor n=1 Tax=Cognaticolwellia mytili TaxID=1888913 RepID=UPI000A178305|nr:ECF-type sigma factor [Cognaticolwellia mytili]
MNKKQSITHLLINASDKESEVWQQIMPLVYDQLHSLASAQFKSERSNHTLQPTALVNETFERLVDSKLTISDRKHFFNLCCQMMRRILVDYARGINSQKRGVESERFSLTLCNEELSSSQLNLIQLDQLLDKLQSLQLRQSQIAELHYFGGLNQSKIAEHLSISPATVFRELRFLKAWLNMQMDNGV